MMMWLVSLVLLSLVAASWASLDSFNSTVDTLLRDIPIVSCINTNVTLHVRAVRWHIDGVLSFTTRAYSLPDASATLPGPLLQLQAGHRCTLTLVNDLNSSEVIAACHYQSNSFHCADTTGLHLHGLHVSPTQDDITAAVLPATNHTFVYDLPSDHLTGTFWYHAHLHGSSALQVSGGMSGPLLVLPSTDYVLPSDLALLYSSPSRRVLHLQHVHFGGDDEGVVDEFRLLDHESLSAAFQPQSLPVNVEFASSSSPREVYMVNGQYRPILTIQTDDATLLQIIHAAPSRLIEVELVQPLSGTCSLVLVARDGIFQPVPYQTLSSIIMYPGNRADVVVTCSAATLGLNITARLFNDSARDAVLGTVNRMKQEVLFMLQVRTTGVTKCAIPTSVASLPSYLTTLISVTTSSLASHLASNIGLEWSDAVGNAINGVPFVGHNASIDIQYLDQLCLNRVYEFTANPDPAMVMMMPSAHPLHIHANAFQIVSVNGLNMSAAGARDVIRVGEWRDTAPSLVPYGITFRMRPTSFVGAVPLHCHIMQHEDLGMFALLSVADCSRAAPFLRDSNAATNTLLSLVSLMLLSFLFV